MLKLASDEDVNGALIRGLRRRRPDLDLVRAQDAGMESRPDAEVLAWAASEGRVLLTNDRKTMVGRAYQRVTARQPMPGLIALTNGQPMGAAIEDILVLVTCLSHGEMRIQVVVYLPL